MFVFVITCYVREFARCAKYVQIVNVIFNEKKKKIEFMSVYTAARLKSFQNKYKQL